MNDIVMNDIVMLVLLVVIVLFVVTLIVLVIHFIGTVRKVNKTIDDIQPTIATANKMLEELQPAVKRIDPLMERVSLTVDAVNLEIMRADTILSDISDVTSTASGAVGKVAEITDAPLNLLNAATDKVKNLFGTSKEKRSAERVVRRAAARNENKDETVADETSAAESDSDPDAELSAAAQQESEFAPVTAPQPMPEPEQVPEPVRQYEPEPALAGAEPEMAPAPEAREPKPVEPEPVYSTTIAVESVSEQLPAPTGVPAVLVTEQEEKLQTASASMAQSVQEHVPPVKDPFSSADEEPRASAVMVNYTPDFEPDDDIDLSQPEQEKQELPVAEESKSGDANSEKKADGFYLFYTDDEGIKEGRRQD